MLSRYVWIILFLFITCKSFAQDSLQKQSVATPVNHYTGDNDHWKWGIFYFNREDKTMFPPKRDGLGWTINFANPSAVGIVLISIIVIIAGNIYYKKYLAQKRKSAGN